MSSGFQIIAVSLALLATACGSEELRGPIPERQDALTRTQDALTQTQDALTADLSPDDANQPLNPMADASDAPVPAAEVDVSVEPDPRSPLVALVRVTSDVEVRVRVRASRGGGSPRWTRWSGPGLEHTVEVLGLTASSAWDLTTYAAPTGGGDEVAVSSTFESGALPAGMPQMIVTSYDPERAAPGLTFFGVTQIEKPNNPKLPLFIAVDPAGEVVWLYQDEATDHDRSARSVQVVDEDTLLLMVGDGFRTISLGGDVKLQVKPSPDLGGALHHDVVRLEGGGFLALAREQREVLMESTGELAVMLGDRVIELNSAGELVWEWSTFDHLDTQHLPTGLSQKPNPKNGSYDWTHANGLAVLEDGDFLLSMRHQHQVARVDRETGELVWLLGVGGDFELLQGQWFYGQHNPTVREDGSVLIYDNGNDRPGGPPYFSRVVGYELDPQALTAEETLSWTVPEYTSFLGGVQTLPNEAMLICAGGVRNASEPGEAVSGVGRLIEVAADADEVWRLEVEGNIYRALRVDGLLWSDE